MQTVSLFAFLSASLERRTGTYCPVQVREYWPTAALTATILLGISASAALFLVIGVKCGVSVTLSSHHYVLQ